MRRRFMSQPARRRSGFTLLDLLTVLIVGLVIGGSSLLFAEAENEDANRTRCADHLRLIGTAVAFYSNENRGACPRTMSVIEKADQPLAYTNPKPELTEEEKDHNVNPAFCKAGPGPNDVTAGLFLLLAMED